MDQFPPRAPDYTIRVISIFSKIHGDIRSSRCTTGGVYTGGRFAASVVDIGGNLPLASLTLVHSGTGLICEMVLVKKLKLEASGHECRL
jgi:hypothetical protein